MNRNDITRHNVLDPWPLDSETVDTIITSPPYWGLRNYGHADQIGQETTPEEFVDHMVQVFREGRRVLKPEGTLWLNIADTYWGGKGQSGGAWQGDHLNSDGQNYAQKGDTRPQDRRHPFIKPKDLVGIPWMVAMALRNDGWYLRQSIIWDKPNPMPESMKDRCTKSHEYIFLLAKNPTYYFDQEAIRQPLKDTSIARLAQDIEAQNGSNRVPEKTKAMKAVGGPNRKEFTGDQAGSGSGMKGHSGYFKEDGTLNVRSTANKKSVWTVATKGFDAQFCTACRRYYTGTEKGLIKAKKCLCGRTDAWVEHFATFPEELIVDCVKAGSPKGGLVLDPFMGGVLPHSSQWRTAGTSWGWN